MDQEGQPSAGRPPAPVRRSAAHGTGPTLAERLAEQAKANHYRSIIEAHRRKAGRDGFGRPPDMDAGKTGGTA